MANKNNIYGTNSSEIRKYVLDKVFHANGSKLYMHVELKKATVSSLITDPIILAQNIVNVCE